MKLPIEMNLKGIKHPGKVQAIQWCSCRGKQHRIALINGSIALLDHNLERELAMLDLGGDPCRCMRVYFAIQRSETKCLIPDFQPFIDEMIRKSKARHSTTTSVVERLHGTNKPNTATQQLIKLLVKHRCRWGNDTLYSRLPDDTVIVVTNTGAKPFARSIWQCKGLLGSDTYLVLQINITKDWRKRVYDRGLSVVDGSLVLEVASDHTYWRRDVTATVTAMQVGEGYRFGTRNATAKKLGNEWRFSWMDPHVYFHTDKRIP